MNKKLKTLDLARIALFVVIMAICSWISIPTVIPFTLQTLGLFLCIGMLGGKNATFTIAVYLLMGIIGVPVFSNFTGGIGIILGAGGGYLIGFLAAAANSWLIESLLAKRKLVPLISMVVGLLLCYVIGTVWYTLVYVPTTSLSALTAITTCVLPYLLPDTLKIALALFVCKRVRIK
ncbi:MAG: biotin transporter BioY [Clostridia bacterium]|nr:biotin transporter BioY [Clostridia bacterium]